MKKFVRFGKSFAIPSTVQIRHELRLFCAEENVRSLCAEGEGLAPGASWDEITAWRSSKAGSPPGTDE